MNSMNMSKTDNDFNIGPIVTPQSFHQLGIFVIDGSGSMNGTTTGNLSKAEAVNLAVRETLTRFKVSRKKDCFSFAVVAFGDYGQVVAPVQKSTEIDDFFDYNPLQFFEGGTGSNSTNIASGLQEALTLANEFLTNKSSNVPHKAAIVVLTDGMCHHESQSRKEADLIKQNPNIQIYCCCLEELGKSYSDAEALLRYIATNASSGYKTVYDKDTIRGFFVNSISAASGLAKIE